MGGLSGNRGAGAGRVGFVWVVLCVFVFCAVNGDLNQWAILVGHK